MAYDPTTESRRMLTEGVPEVPFRLTRRRRHIPVAYDVDGDAAATLFLRRGVSGDPWLESWTFEHRAGEWVFLGGGAGNHYEEVFEPRPSVTVLGGPAVLYGGGSTNASEHRVVPWGARWIHSAKMRLASEVQRLALGDRTIDVPPHGLAIVVWRSKRPPLVEAVSNDGRRLGPVELRTRP